MPELATHFRVIRPDMRGYGRSTRMPVDYPWTVDGVIDDFVKLADDEIDRFHLVAGKIGGALALRFAAYRPERIRTLTVVAPRTLGKVSSNTSPDACARSPTKASRSGRDHGIEARQQLQPGDVRGLGAPHGANRALNLDRFHGNAAAEGRHPPRSATSRVPR